MRIHTRREAAITRCWSGRALISLLAWSAVWPAISLVIAQNPSPQGFEVASIRKGSQSGECLTNVSGMEANFQTCTLKTWLSWFLQITPWQQLLNQGPGWIATDRFTIRAKASRPFRNPREATLMLGRLLQDRFGIVWHTEKREAPVYFLSITSRAALKSAPPGKCQPVDPAAPPGPPSPDQCGRLLVTYTADGEGILANGHAATMDNLVSNLSLILGRQIIDRTGLAGEYDLSLHFARDASIARSGPPILPPVSDVSPFPNIFTAIRKLGLKLTAGKASLDVFVIDNAHMPTEN